MYEQINTRVAANAAAYRLRVEVLLLEQELRQLIRHKRRHLVPDLPVPVENTYAARIAVSDENTFTNSSSSTKHGFRFAVAELLDSAIPVLVDLQPRGS